MPLSAADLERIENNRARARVLKAAREQAARTASPITSLETAARIAAAQAAVCGRKDHRCNPLLETVKSVTNRVDVCIDALCKPRVAM